MLGNVAGAFAAEMPKEEQDRILKLVEQNPDLFHRIATELQEKMKSGMDQMSAALEVMRSHESELRKIM